MNINIAPLTHILDTMQSWLDGEQVWPHARIIETWGSDFDPYWMHREITAMIAKDDVERLRHDYYVKRIERGAALWALRDQWIARFGFAIPCTELLDELAKAEHVVDVGAGTGYMTRLMRHCGVDVIGSDKDWRGQNSHGFMTAQYDEKQVAGTDAKTMVRRYPESTIFCSWPTLNATWFRQMLHAMQIGQKLVVIREDACAESSAWQYLDDCFEQTATIEIPTFDHMHDYAMVAVKKRQRTRRV